MEQGTRALLFKNGKYIDELVPGHHAVTGTLSLSKILGVGNAAKVLDIWMPVSPR